NTLMALRTRQTGAVRRRSPAPPVGGVGLWPLATTSAEDYVLALLLQNPALKSDTAELALEVFTGTENREIYRVWMETEDIPALQERLAAELREHLDDLMSRKPPETRNNVQDKFADSVRRLLKKHWKSLAAKRGQTDETSDDIGMKIHELETLDSRKGSSSRR
ncbi:MAG: hypothetical protein MUO19_07295, partial [Dehalococcoidales bacterium]|nr:hypothetical protein [Dehalococcoidales bacterium]